MNNKNSSIFKISVIVISIIAMSLTGCSNTSDVEKANQIQSYVVNTRSKKIHSETCQYVSKMSEKNKMIVQDSLLDLLKEDYVICRKCRAGVKKTAIGDIVDRLFHRNLYIDDVGISATYEEYLAAIDEMGNWYVNHIPTYASRLQEELLSDYDGKLENYNIYELQNNGLTSTYIVLSDDESDIATSILDKSDSILKANENAVQYYISEYDNIEFNNKIAYYPCDILSTESDYYKPGDDCVRFMFAVLNKMDGQFTTKYQKLSQRSFSKTNSTMLTGDAENIAFGLINLGFKVYDISEKPVMVGVENSVEGYISKIDEDFKLQKGDIIAQNGHVHFYLGDGAEISADNFGWGKVNRSYPQTYEIEVKKLEDGLNYIVLTNNQGVESYYSRVYRYIGSVEGE